MSAAFLYTAAVGICTGIALGLLFAPGAIFIGILLVVAAVAFFFAKRNARVLLIPVALASLALGLVRADLYDASLGAQTVTRYVGQTVGIDGTVAQDPDKRATSLHITLDVSAVNGAPERGRVLIILPRETELAYGEKIDVRGTLEAPQAFASNGGREFDYPGYLRAQGILATMQKATLVKNAPPPFSLQGFLFSLKHGFEASLERVLPEPQVSLLEGVMLGERRGIPQDLTNAFIQTGLIHVVVLSGYNIAIVATATLTLLSFLPRRIGFSLGSVLMVLFAVMTGAGSTTVRALLMALIAILAQYFHRSSDALRSLAVAAAALVLWNPPALLFDPSYILSVCATFGLITLSPSVEGLLLRVPVLRNQRLAEIRTIAAATIAVQLFVLPALLYFTGILSATALPANVLALPVVPITMLLGFMTGLAGFVHPLLALPFALVTNALLSWMLFIARTFASLPFAATTLPAFPAWLAALAFVPLTLFAIWRYRRTAPPLQTS